MQAVYRIRRFRQRGETRRGYRHSLEVTDEHTGRVLATCHLDGRASAAPLAITDDASGEWTLEPNRRVMPSRWTLKDPATRPCLQFDQKLLGKLSNPLHRVVLAVLDAEGAEIFRLVDPRTSVPDRVLGAGPGDWALLEADRPVVRLVSLPSREEPTRGLLGKLRMILTPADRGLVSEGEEHVLTAPAALAMVALHEELTDASGGAA